MCGRYTQFAKKKALMERFKIAMDGPELTPRYNIAPGSGVPVILEDRDRKKKRRLDYMQWGLVPSWAKSANMGFKCINAKWETADTKPAFKDSMKYRRCLIPATGWYEWKKFSDRKQPYYLYCEDDPLFAFAGLWAEKLFPDGSELLTCSILTRPAADHIAHVHHRMPYILRESDYDSWLTTNVWEPVKSSYTAVEEVSCHTVTPEVGKTNVESPTLIERWEPSERLNAHIQTFFPGM